MNYYKTTYVDVIMLILTFCTTLHSNFFFTFKHVVDETASLKLIIGNYNFANPFLYQTFCTTAETLLIAVVSILLLR